MYFWGHTSTTDDTPGVGVNWETYWVLYSGRYIPRGISNSVVYLSQKDYYIDRPIDLRGYRSSLMGQPGITYPSGQVVITCVDSAHWDLDVHRSFPPDYPYTGGGTTAAIFMGIMEYNRVDAGAKQTLTNQYNQSLQNLSIDSWAITPTVGVEFSSIYHEGSLEENTRLVNVSGTGFTGYGFGGSRMTIFNGFTADGINMFASSDGVPICWMAVGTTWELSRATLNAISGSTNCQYIARVGGRCAVMRNIHMETANVVGIDVVYNWYGYESSTGGGGSPPNITLDSVEGYSLSAGASVIRINNNGASVNATNIVRGANEGVIIEDINTGKSSNGMQSAAGSTVSSVTQYVRQVDYTSPTGYYVNTTDPNLAVYNIYNVTSLTSLSAYAGMKVFTSDSNQPLSAGYGTPYVTGGANVVPIYYTGSTWLIG